MRATNITTNYNRLRAHGSVIRSGNPLRRFRGRYDAKKNLVIEDSWERGMKRNPYPGTAIVPGKARLVRV